MSLRLWSDANIFILLNCKNNNINDIIQNINKYYKINCIISIKNSLCLPIILVITIILSISSPNYNTQANYNITIMYQIYSYAWVFIVAEK